MVPYILLRGVSRTGVIHLYNKRFNLAVLPVTRLASQARWSDDDLRFSDFRYLKAWLTGSELE